jgi:hypothetical protein
MYVLICSSDIIEFMSNSKHFLTIIISDNDTLLMLFCLLLLILKPFITAINGNLFYDHIFSIFYYFIAIAYWMLILKLVYRFDSSKIPYFVYRIGMYSLLFILSKNISEYVYSTFGFSNTNVDSARYFLSAIIQSEAAMVAIVISLSIIAVQQNSKYSSRIINIFKSWKSNPDFYIIFTVYLFSIYYNLWILKQISVEDLTSLSMLNFGTTYFVKSFEEHLIISLSVSFFAFASLFLYTQNTLELLNPLNVITILSSEINKKSLNNAMFGSRGSLDREIGSYDSIIDTSEFTNLKYYKNKPDKSIPSNTTPISILISSLIEKETNPYQPIVDMIYTSLYISDFQISRKGINAITTSLIKTFDVEFESDGAALFYLYNEMVKIGTLAIEKQEDYCAEQVSAILYYINILYMKRSTYKETTTLVSGIIFLIKFASLNNKESSNGLFLPKNRNLFVDSALISLSNIGHYAILNNHEQATLNVIASLSISVKFFRDEGLNELKVRSKELIDNLVDVGLLEELEYMPKIRAILDKKTTSGSCNMQSYFQ